MKKGPMLVGFYTVATHLGGAERSSFDFLSRLEERSQGRYRPIVFLPKSEGPLVELLRQAKIQYEVVPIPTSIFKMTRSAPWNAMKAAISSIPEMKAYLRTLKRLFQENEIALLHTNGLKCHLLGALLGMRARTPVLWHLRDIFPKGPTLWALRFFSRSPFVYAVANSQATADAYRAPNAHLHVVHNGFDSCSWTLKLKEPQETVIGILGVLARWKGQVEFLHMAKDLLDQGIQARFKVIGGEIYDTQSDRDYGLQLKQEAKNLGIESHVDFTGFIQEPMEALKSLSVVVHASLKPEAFGRVIVEAMACGTPVVACADGGVLEILTHEKTGLLYSPGNVKEMVQSVSRLLKDIQLRTLIIHQARTEFENRFTVEKYVDGVIQVYDRICVS